VEAAERHGLSKPIRLAVYSWFDRWLAGREAHGPAEEVPVAPRRPQQLRVCAEGQVNRTFQSQHLLPMALEEFERKGKPPRSSLRDVLQLDPESAAPVIEETRGRDERVSSVILCIRGNEAGEWVERAEFLTEQSRLGHRVVVVGPRGTGESRFRFDLRGRDYADALDGVDENIAYNAFLVGKSLLGMRVTDVVVAAKKLHARWKPKQLVLCGRRDAALVACLAAAVEPLITHVAVEEMLLSFRSLFSVQGTPINAASILPGLLDRFGDVPEILAQISPRKVLIAAGIGGSARGISSVRTDPSRFSENPRLLTDWLGE
jgi:hypothetical protein